MSVYQKALRVFSIVTIVMGAIVLVAGAVVIVTAFLTGTSEESQLRVEEALAAQGLEGVNGSEVAFEVASMGVTVAFLGALFVATGVFGLIGAKDPALTLPVLVLSIIGLALAMLNLVGGFVSGSFLLPGSGATSLMTAVGNVAVMGFMMGLAMFVRAQGRGGD